jgi:hypothetical protein
LKKELENKKPLIPENGKTNRQDKRKKKANKMPLWSAQGPSLSWRSAALSVPVAKSKLLCVAIHGAFLVVEESWTLTDMKTLMLKRAQRPSTPHKDCS